MLGLKGNRVLLLGGAIAGICFGTLASAGEDSSYKLSVMSGKALVSKGEGFVPVVGATNLKAGDRVAVLDGNVRIVKTGGCTIKLKPRSITTIEASMPCNAQAQSEPVDVVAQQSPRPLPAPVLTPAPGTIAGIPIGALAVGGGVALAAGLTVGFTSGGNNNDRTTLALLLASQRAPIQPISP